MTSFFKRKVVGDNYYDRCVIVDNSVEIGDFFADLGWIS